MKILWVEDKIDEVISIFEALSFRGHIITIATSKEDAEHELALGWKGDLVILDSFLPNDDGSPSHTGPDILEGLKAGRWGAWGVDVQVVFITGFLQDVQNALNKSGTPARIIVKPVATETAIRSLAESVPEILPSIHVSANGNSKVAVSVGPGNAEAKGLSQSLAFPLPDETAAEIRKLATAWLNDTGNQTMEASQRLINILASGNDATQQKREVEGFRKWVVGLGVDVRQALATGASLVGIAVPLLQALGIIN